MIDKSRPGERAHRRSARIGVRRLGVALAAVTCMLIASVPGSGAAQIPVNDLAPEVVGTPAVGERLVCGAGSWIGSVSGFSYEWFRQGTPVHAGLTYVVTNADKGRLITCFVTAIGSEGSAEAQSANSIAIPGEKPPEGPPENTAAPQVSGRPAVGETLSCSTGTWSGTPAPTFTYQWMRDAGAEETVIAAATASTHLVVSEDQGHSLACRVTATNGAGESASKLSANSVRVAGTKPENEVAPRVLGIEPSAVGASLTCSPGTWSETPAPSFSYRWIRHDELHAEAVIEGATSSTYTVAPADQRRSLSCKVIATNSAGSTEESSSNSLEVLGSKPENTTAPGVSGTPAVGETLSCEPGAWSGVPTPTISYVWVRDPGPDQEAVGSANSSTYIPGIEDRGHSLTCVVTAVNIEGSAWRGTEAVVIPADAGGVPPQNETVPTVSGEPAVGATVTCAQGTWNGSPSPTLTFQWLRDSSPIASATGGSYVVANADQGHALSCRVIAINNEGIASASTTGLEIPGTPPQELEPPQVLGTPSVGEPLTCLPGTWNGEPTPTFAYQWLRGGSEIPSATAGSYVVTSEDRGESISCRVTARNSAGMMEAPSSNGVEIRGGEPRNLSAPEVSGTAAVGGTLTCSPGTWNGQPAPTYSYQWQLAGADIPSATASTFTVVAVDGGLTLSCRVTAHNHEGTESATSKGVHVPGSKPAEQEAPQVSGTPAVGQQLTCVRGKWSGQPPPAFTYQWLRDGTSMPAATSATHTVELADQGHALSCAVTATNTEGTSEAESSNVLAILRGTVRTEIAPEVTFAPFARVAAKPTAAQLLAALRSQLTRAQHRARVTSLQKAGLYAFSFTALGRGTLEFYWYEASSAAHHSTYTKPVLLALSSTSFSKAATRTVKLRLTSAGRRLISRSQPITLMAKGTFFPSPGRPVSWFETVALSR